MAENAGLPQEYFDRMYDKADDPWSFSTRWYERRKRALTMAALTRPRYASVLELGCSIGLLTEQLADRADTVVSLDISAEAVERARRTLADRAGVRVELADVRDGLPPGPFELIVVSEVAYYLSRTELEALAATIASRLDSEGEVLLCHWRWPVDDYPLGGDEAQEILIRSLAMPRLGRLEEDDLVLDVLSRNARSVAVREGLV